MIKRVRKATGEYATSETVVWWDMDNCPLPNGYDPSRLAPRIETELKSLGYNGPVTIVAGGNLYGIPYEFLKTLSSTGVVLKHTTSGLSVIVPSYLDRRTSDSPPLSIMLITTDYHLLDSIIREMYMGVLVGYNLLLAYPPSYEPEDPHPSSLVSVGGEWLWSRESLLKDSGEEEETRRRRLVELDTRRSCEMFSCASCPFSPYGSFEDFIEHLEDEKHKTILEPSTDDEEMMIRVDAENLEALKQSKRYIDLLEAKKLEYERLHKHINDPGMMFKADILETDDEEYVSPLLQMIKERQKKENKNSERLKNEREARKLKFEKWAGETLMAKANILEIDNEESESPKESQKKKNSEWLKKNKVEAKELECESAHNYFSEPEKTLITKANNLEIDNEESESPLLQMEIDETVGPVCEARNMPFVENDNEEALFIKMLQKNSDNQYTLTIKELQKDIEMLKTGVSKMKLISDKDYFAPRKTLMTKANNLEIDNEESESPLLQMKIDETVGHVCEARNVPFVELQEDVEILKAGVSKMKLIMACMGEIDYVLHRKTLMTKANNLEIDNEESESPKESQKKKNSEWLKKNKVEAKELECESAHNYFSEPEKTLITKANNLEIHNAEVALDQIIMELQKNIEMLKNGRKANNLESDIEVTLHRMFRELHKDTLFEMRNNERGANNLEIDDEESSPLHQVIFPIAGKKGHIYCSDISTQANNF